MSEWKEEPLGELTIFIKDGSHGTHKDCENGIPLLSAKDVVDGKVLIPDDCRKISQKDFEQIHSSYQIELNDLVLTIVGTIGRVALIKKTDQKITFQRSVGLFRFNESKIKPHYCYHYFASNQFQQSLERAKNASAQGGVYLGELAKIKISYPKQSSVQCKIARILSTCDAVIEKTQAAIDKYKSIKQGMLHDLFTRGIDPATGKLRPKYEDAPALYKKSKLGMVPVEWFVEELMKFLSYISYGFTNPMPETNDGPFLVTAANVNNGRIQYETCRKTSKDAYDNLLTDKSRPKINDILLTKDGTLGRVALVEQENLCINQSVSVLRPNKLISPLFLKILLESPGYQKIMIDEAGGSTIKHIYITKVDKMLLTVPKLSIEQETIVERLTSVNEQLQTEQKYLHKLQQIKAGLMSDLLSGRKRVSVPEEALAVVQ